MIPSPTVNMHQGYHFRTHQRLPQHCTPLMTPARTLQAPSPIRMRTQAPGAGTRASLLRLTSWLTLPPTPGTLIIVESYIMSESVVRLQNQLGNGSMASVQTSAAHNGVQASAGHPRCNPCAGEHHGDGHTRFAYVCTSCLLACVARARMKSRAALHVRRSVAVCTYARAHAQRAAGTRVSKRRAPNGRAANVCKRRKTPLADALTRTRLERMRASNCRHHECRTYCAHCAAVHGYVK